MGQEQRWMIVASVLARHMRGDTPGALLSEALSYYRILDRTAAKDGLAVPRLLTPPMDPCGNPGAVLAAHLVALVWMTSTVPADDRLDPTIRRLMVDMAVRAMDTAQLGRFERVDDAEAVWQLLGATCEGMVETGFAGAAGDDSMREEFEMQSLEAAAAAITVLTLVAEPAPSRRNR